MLYHNIFNTFGMHLEYIWNTLGIHLSSRNTLGIHFGNTLGTHLEYKIIDFGKSKVSLLSNFINILHLVNQDLEG